MKETQFIEQNKDKWAEYEQLMRDNNSDPERMSELFIQVTDDLSYARTFYPTRSVRAYLNGMAQRIFHHIYKGKRLRKERLRLFWTDEVPALMWLHRRALLLSFLIFVLAFGIGVLSSMINPDFARVVLGDSYVDMTLENIQKGDPMAVYKDSRPLGMTLGIAANNLFVAMRTAIFGVLASVGTVFIMLYNGIMVGAFQYFFIEKGLFWPSFLTIWIHGTLEISAIIIAGAAGLVAGSGLLFPGTYTRAQAFSVSMRQGLKIFIGVAPIIVLAAIFEGFLTRFTETPDVIRGAFILVSALFVLWYFVWLPWHKARHGLFSQQAFEREAPPLRQETVSLVSIKNAGEILSDAFTMFRRYPGALPGGALLATAMFLLAGFGASDRLVTERFFLGYDTFSMLNAVPLLFSDGLGDDKSWLLPLVQLAILTGLGSLVSWAFAREATPKGQAEPTWRSILWRQGIFLLIGAMVFIGAMSITSADNGTGRLARLAFWFLPLILAHTYASALMPERALLKSMGMIRWGQVVLIGGLLTGFYMLFLLFLNSELWSMTLHLFSWLVPPGDDTMSQFETIAKAGMLMLFTYLYYLMILLTGFLLFYSNREIATAAQLHADISKIGTTTKIRGLPREN
ncbi:MAG: stage II sporulation protein M [Saprospiraceae bacterium]|nr:stage II sporulation protein M [Saprospiraceae bacterium]